MTKKTFDITKYIPIAIMAVSLVSGTLLLKARVGSTEDRATKLEDKVDEQGKEYAQINVSQATLQSKVDSSFEILKEIKDSLKEIKRDAKR